jgi:hypothetical protein
VRLKNGETGGYSSFPLVNYLPVALTYARRYAYMAALDLVADQDDDGNQASQNQRSRPAATRSTSKPKARPARAADADKETGEVPPPPDLSAAIEKLDQESRAELKTMLEKANISLDNAPPAAAKQVERWIEKLMEAQKMREPFA